MTLNDFEQKIDPVILSRGRRYYASGMVVNLYRESPDTISAEVEGSNLYDVEITLKKNRITDFSCTCPYNYGPVCKHIAALLYSLSAMEDLNAIPVDPEAEEIEKAKNTIRKLSEERLRNLVLSQAESNPVFRNFLLARHGEKDHPNETVSYYKQMIEESYSDLYYKGYIHYDQADRVTHEADNLIAEAQICLIDEEFDQVFTMTRAVIESMFDVWPDVDDSFGSVGYSIDSAMKTLIELSESKKLSKNLRNEIFAYLLSKELLENLSEKSENWIALRAAAVMAENGDEEEMVLSAGREQCRAGEGFGEYYDREQFAELTLHILEKHRSRKEVDEFFTENIHFPSFRERALKKLMEEKKYIQVIDLAKDGIAEDKDSAPGLVSQWKKWIMMASQQSGDKKIYREYAESLYLGNPDMNKYSTLKKSYPPAEWDVKLEELLKKVHPNKYHYREVLIHENRIGDLWESFSGRLTLEDLEHYGQYILEDYHKTIMDELEKEIPYRLYNMKDRKFYARIARMLRKVSQAGEEYRIKQLAASLMVEYRNRRALREELTACHLL